MSRDDRYGEGFMVTITSKKDGFRRCGVAHAATATEYQDGAFTKQELAELQAEPLLTVVVSKGKTTTARKDEDKE